MSEVAAKVLSMSLRQRLVCETIFTHRARFRSKEEEEEEEEKEKEGRKKQGKDLAGKRQIFASSSSPAGQRPAGLPVGDAYEGEMLEGKRRVDGMDELGAWWPRSFAPRTGESPP
jgi:hypothetical protein